MLGSLLELTLLNASEETLPETSDEAVEPTLLEEKLETAALELVKLEPSQASNNKLVNATTPYDRGPRFSHFGHVLLRVIQRPYTYKNESHKSGIGHIRYSTRYKGYKRQPR